MDLDAFYLTDYLLLIYGPFNFGHICSHLTMKNCVLDGILYFFTYGPCIDK